MLTFHPPILTALPKPNAPELRLTNTPEPATALLIAELASRADSLLLVLVEKSQDAQRLANALHFYLGQEHLMDAEGEPIGEAEIPIIHLPDWETLPYDSFSPHEDIISERLKALSQLSDLTRGILILPVQTLAHRVAPRSHLDGQRFVLSTGDTFDLIAERRRLERAGYHAVETVHEHGEFAVRGAILDVFPMGTDRPLRIELFDNEIESLRAFDPDTQRTISKVDRVTLLPAREIPMTETGIANFRQNWHETFEGNPRDCSIYQDVSSGLAPPGIEYYAPLFFNEMATLFDYLPASTTTIRIGAVHDALEQFWADVSTRYESLRYDRRKPLLPPERLFLRTEELFSAIKPYAGVEVIHETVSHPRLKPLPDVAFNAKADDPAAALKAFLSRGVRALFVAESPGRREALLELLAKYGLRPDVIHHFDAFTDQTGPLAITLGLLDAGLCVDDLAIIPEAQLFGRRVPQRRRRRQHEIATDLIVRDLAEINLGDPIVHIDHGVGFYRGLETITLGDEVNEFVTVEYQAGAKLYIPVANLGVLSRYAGGDPDAVTAHKLGTDRWSKAKQKAAEEIRDKAAELLDIYAKRAAKEGFAHEIDESQYARFADSFPFELTPDQDSSIEAVLNDMRSPRPMDRLVCGDVGFGKTEVAMRAAFAAVSCEKQVCILVPTTLLAQQHFESFRDRFADWPITVDVLSRFKSAKDTKTVIDKANRGQVDILVGTHKLLSSDLKLPNLGLLIIDEEHRFGVQQKEKLKKYRTNVDILTLTATPIPRTLNLSMAGIRDLSVIATPPARRLSVKTFIKQKDDALIKEAILRELLRGGQVYYLHNEVKSIERSADDVRHLVPEARVIVAHGQMRERELEEVMSDFYHKRYNVLVCSTIIETGIDIPSANTILIERADRFGLAQLHQLRGRVGRSHHQAYAYLLTGEPSSMTPDALKRLEAIEAASDLGAGFQLATHDLEIRGAGELLGEDQSGNMQTIGFSLYMEMLEEAVNAIREGRTPDFDQTESAHAEVDLKIPALIPNDFIHEVPIRLQFYKRIGSATDAESLGEIEIEMIDRFGLLPPQVKNLFHQALVRLKAENLGIAQITLGPQSGRIEFREKTKVDPMTLITLVQSKPNDYKLEGATALKVIRNTVGAEQRLQFMNDVLDGLGRTKHT
jgi:transcription-repair coupling factor (superfamily II helicase)